LNVVKIVAFDLSGVDIASKYTCMDSTWIDGKDLPHVHIS